MPVTKTAKRALRGSNKKREINKIIVSKLEVAIRAAKKNVSKENVLKAVSLADKAAKKNAIHRNKASRLKAMLAKLSPKTKTAPKKKTPSKK